MTGARICKRLRRPGIDSEDSIPPAYLAWRASTTGNRVVVPASQAGNRCLGSLKSLQIRTLCTGTAVLVLARPLDKEGVTGLASLSLRNKIHPEGTVLMYEFLMYRFDTLYW
jgi:hypothetical protein